MEGEVIYQWKESKLSKFDHDNLIKNKTLNTLVHGDFALPPLDSVEHGSLFWFIRAGWNSLRLEEGNRLQRCVWPQVVRGYDTLIVSMNKSRSGKTLSYLAPVCAMLNSDAIGWKKVKGKGPVALILTHNTYSAIKVEHLAQTLLSSSSINPIQCKAVTSFSSESHKQCSGAVEIIITTPELFMEKADSVSWLKFERLKFFVVDDVHYSFRTKKELTNNLFSRCKNIVNKDMHSPQIIICGAEWSEDIESLYLNMPRKPTIVIGSTKAAIPYGKIKCQVQYVDPGYKLSTLMTLLEKQTSNPSYNRIIVACGSQETCKEVYSTIESYERYIVRLCSVRNRDEMKANHSVWNSAARYECVVFVVDDEVLRFFDIQEASYLIHYDIENLSITDETSRGSVFFDRFLCLWDNTRNITQDAPVSKYEKRAMCDILMTTEEKDLDRIVKTFLSIGFKIPNVILKQAGQMRRQRETKWPLCTSLKLTGQCENQHIGTCEYRHTPNVEELTKKSAIPRSGTMEVVITQVTTVNSYIGKLIKYIPDGGEKTQNMKKDLNDRHFCLLKHFDKEINRMIPPKSLTVGSLCAVLNENDEYTRGKIVKILTRSANGTPDFVKVFCVDTGENVTRKAQVELYKLPTDMEDLPYLSVEIILVGLQPPFDACEYSPYHLKSTRSTALDNVFKAKVCMSLDNTVWVSSMQLISTVKSSLSLREELIQRKCAASNPLHETWIWTVNSRILDPSSDVFFASNFYNAACGYDWAFLCQSDVVNPVTELFSITHFDTPHCMYGNLGNFVTLLDNLNDDLRIETENLISIRYKEYAEHFINYYTVGLVVAVAENEEWFRGIITEITEGDEYYDEWGDLLPKSSYTYFTVFMVDYGETLKVQSKSLCPIYKKLVKRLPFQAIRISTYLIVQKEDEWSQECIDYLNDKFRASVTSKNFSVVALNKLERYRRPSYPPFKYNVIAFTLEPPFDELSEELVIKGFAEYHGLAPELYMEVKKSLSSQSDLPASDEAHFDEQVWDVNIPELENPPEEVNDPEENKENIPVVRSYTTDRAPRPTRVAASNTTRFPLTRWRQTPDELFLTIILPDIQNLKFLVGQQRQIVFTCDPNYEFKIQVFGFVHETGRNLTGQRLQVKFGKRVSGMWPHLTQEPESLHWLKYDFSYADYFEEGGNNDLPELTIPVDNPPVDNPPVDNPPVDNPNSDTDSAEEDEYLDTERMGVECEGRYFKSDLE